MARRTNLALVIVAVSGLFALCEPMWSSERVEGLIAHWKFDEGGGTVAYDSVGGNDGSLVGGPVWTSGRIGGALDFDGVDDYVDVGDPADDSLDFEAGDSFSISAWIKTDDENGQIVYKRKYTGVGGYQEGYRLRLLWNLLFGIEDTSGNGISILGDTMVADDQWHHVVAVRDTATDKLYLYLDGSSDATPVTDPTIETLATDRSLEIGRADSTVSPYLSYHDGKIDDVRIYERALSAEEVQQLYLAGAGPISHWKFDEGEGDIAYDSAGDNDGTIHGANWTTGQIDGALDFDGENDYVDLGNDNSLKPPLPVTLSAWIRFSQNNATLISLDDLSSKYCGVWLNINLENHLSVAFGDGKGRGAPRYRRSKNGTTALGADTWYHAAVVVRSAKDMSIYLNGEDDGGSYSGTGGSLAYSSGSASIGTAHFENKYFNGEIDDVRIYDRALSAEEIRQLYRKGVSEDSTRVHTMSAINNIGRAIREKVEAWKRIDDTLKKEWATYDALEEMLRSGDYGDLSYSGIVTARQEIYASIGHGQQSKEALEKSIERLESALAALGFELVPKASAWLEQAKRAMP